MKLFCLLLVSILTTSVSAKRHRLCCCAGFNACNQFVCDGPVTQSLVNTSDGEYIRSTKSWEKNTGSPCGGPSNWMYSSNEKGKGDGDGYLGGKEVSDQCFLFGLSSRCFNHKDYKNDPDPKIKERDKYPMDPYHYKHPHPVVGGGERGSRQGTPGDKDHWGTCPSK